MIKSILLVSAIILTLFSCNDSKVYTVAPKAIIGSPLSAVSITSAVQPDQDCKELRTKYVVLDSTFKEYLKMFDAAVIRLDSLVGYNNELEKKLRERNAEIGKLRQQIRTLTEK
jgi:peptidoglycan hydrolase CwlO-like protein